MIQLVGILKDPMGSPLVEDTIRVTALDSIGNTLEGSEALFITGADGSYDFTLEFGKYQVEINYEDEFHLIGSVIVEENTPSPITINHLVLVGTPVVPPIIVDTDPNWNQLFQDVQTTGLLTDNHQQIREGDLYTSEVKENWKAPTAQMSDESLESNAIQSNLTSQLRTYSDDNLNEAALITQEGRVDGSSIYTSKEVYKASNGKQEAKTVEQLSTSKGTIEKSSSIDDVGMASTESLSFLGSSVMDNTSGDGVSLVRSQKTQVGDREREVVTSYQPTHTHEGVSVAQPHALQEASLKLAETINSILHSAVVVDTHEVAVDASELARALKESGLTVYDKEAFQRLTIESGQSKQVTQVDNFLVQDDAASTVVDIDTVNKKLKVFGKLEVSNPEDFKGDTGDVYDTIYQYSNDNGVVDVWEATYEVGDQWRRERKTLNGVEIGAWSDGYYIFAKDGRDGDTYYNQYQYSTNDATKTLNQWHNSYVDGDDWRRWRVIENSVPVPPENPLYGPEDGWFVERMKGLDGPAGWVPHLQYQYSIDGLPPWHNDFTEGDAWRREKVDWYGSNQDFLDKDNPVNPSTPVLAGTWTSGVKIAPVDGADYGDKYATVIMYQRSNSDTPPADPFTITYNFDTATITPALSNGWSANVPEGLEDIWIAVGTAHSRTNEDTIDDWVVEKQVANGYKSGIAWLYQATDKSTVLGSVDLPAQPLVYDFLTGKVKTPTDPSWLKGWTAEVPSIPDEGLLWVTFNTALTPVAQWEDTLDAEDWELPAISSKGGLHGLAGAFTTFIFKNSATNPANPVGGSFDGSTEVVPTGWADDPTYTEGQITWVSRAKYTFDGSTWEHTGWSVPSVYVIRGVEGYTPEKGIDYFDGKDGSFTSFIYRNAVSKPTAPSGGSFNGTVETPPTNWTDDPIYVEGETTWISKAKYVTDGTSWSHSGWSDPVLHIKEGEDGYTPIKGIDYFDGKDGSFVSFIFRNSPTQPTTPTDGSFNGTLETPPTNWTDNPAYVAGEITWISKAKYTFDGTSWSHSGWSAPSIHIIQGEEGYTPVKGVDYFDGKDGSFTSFIFKNAASLPASPTGGSFNGTTEVTPTGWSNDPVYVEGEITYISSAKYTFDGSVWSHTGWSAPVLHIKEGVDGYTPIKGVDYFDGKDGSFVSFIFRNALTQPAIPSGGSFNGTTETPPTNWTDNPSYDIGQITWVSKTKYVFDGSVWNHAGWSEPSVHIIRGAEGYTPIKGVDYFDGKDGSFTSFIYKNATSLPTTPTGGSFDGTTETTPTNWSDDPVFVTGETTYISTAKYTFDGTSWSHTGWSTPVLHAREGEDGYTPVKGVDYFDGVDGSFVSFIFRNAVSKPALPTGGSFDGTTETSPTNWTDNPSYVEGEVTWVSTAKYQRSGANWVHAGWSDPTIYVIRGEEGYTPVKGVDYFDGKDGSFKSFIYKNGVTQPTTPTGGSFNGTTETPPTGWNDNPVHVSGETTWLSTAKYVFDGTNWNHTGWSTPVLHIKEGEDGYTPVKGIDYFDGIDGVDGTSGTSGSGWYYLNNVPSSWFLSDESFNWATYGKNNGTSSVKYLFNQAFGKDPVDGDVLAVNTIDGVKSDTGLYDVAADNGNGAFAYVNSLINGNMIIDGSLRVQKLRANSITGDKINSTTTITAGSGSTTAGMNGDDVGGDTKNRNYRFWAGAVNAEDAPFKVKSDGSAHITKGDMTLGEGRAGEGYVIHNEDGSKYYDDNGLIRVKIGKLS